MPLVVPFVLPGFELHSTTVTDTLLTITAVAVATASTCPRCQMSSTRVHSYYTRQPHDVPVSEWAVRLILRVRRFRCLNSTCPTKTFAERLPHLVAPAGHRTVRATRMVQHLGFALGGEAGSRLAHVLHLPTSPDTLLRAVRHVPLPERPTPRVLGVDDWAIQRGRTYGTLLVDLERHRPVDLLPDRTAETLAAWLQAHPGVEIISRDRSTEYARGALLGAPQAQHVLDRWHLLRNLTDALERLLDRIQRRLRILPPSESTSKDVSIYERSTRRSTTDQAARVERRSRRLERYDAVRVLHDQGITNRQIARQLGMSRTTVIRYLRAESFPERVYSRRRSMLDPYAAYLQQRWDAGCHNGTQLWREIREKGYSGSPRLVSNWVVLRRERLLGHHSGYGRRPVLPEQLQPQSASATPKPSLPAPRQMVWLLLHDPSTMTVEDQGLLLQIEQDRDVKQAGELAQRFGKLVRERTPADLDSWLDETLASGIPELCSFAAGLQREHVAVRAALELPYSNGQVEGQVTKLKLLKRQGYGRAKLDLLRQRMLYAA